MSCIVDVVLIKEDSDEALYTYEISPESGAGIILFSKIDADFKIIHRHPKDESGWYAHKARMAVYPKWKQGVIPDKASYMS